ncbi:hypothetical protein PHYSODRAFT_525625, partial [Phytophthora sojae]
MNEQRGTNDFKLDGVRLPKYTGHESESFRLYQEELSQYFEARNIDWKNERWATRVLAIIGSTLKGQAGQWYLARKHEIYSAEQLLRELARAFVPADLQLRLREQLRHLNQKSCKSLGDYVSRFRNIVLQVEDMTEIDKVVYFSQGLMPNTHQEVLYKRRETLTDAITVAMDYERSH